MPRVHELARELGTDSAAVLAHLKAHGFSYRSASQRLDPPAVRFLRSGEIPPAPPRDPDSYDPPPPLSVMTGDAARWAGVSPATIRQWAARGYLTPTGTRGRSALYDRDAVGRVAKDRRRNTDAQRRPVPRVKLASRDLDSLVTTRDAAQIAGVTPATIRTWAARGHLGAASEPGRRPQLYRVQDVLKAARRPG